MRDSAGIRIVESAGPTSSNQNTWRVQQEPMLTIGTGSEEEQLFRVVGVVTLVSGRIAVANAGTYQVRIFARDGTLVQVLGGEGDGPGEVRSLYGMYRLEGDSLAIHDTQLQRITVFDHEGDFARSFTTTWPEGATRVVPAGPLGSTGWLMMFGQRLTPDLQSGYLRLNLYLARYDHSGLLRDTLATLPGFELYIHDMEGGRVVPTVLFGRGAGVATANDRFWVALNDSYEIREYGTTGVLKAIYRRTFDPRKVTAADLDSARSLQLDLFQGVQFRRLVAAAYERMAIPETMPALGRPATARVPWIVVDLAGGFWVVDYDWRANTPATWSVFDSEGKFVRSLELPAGFDLFEVGAEHVLGVWRDALDVESVVMYALERF